MDRRGFSFLSEGPQRGGAGQAAGISMLRGKNRRVRFVTENVLLQTGRNIFVDARNLRSASSNHDGIRIEKVDQVRQRPCEAVFESLECSQRGRFTGVASRDDLGAPELNARRAMIIHLQTRSGNPRFDATVSSAIARRTGKLLRAHPGQGVMAPFARNSV